MDNCATAFRGLFLDTESHVLVMCDTVYAYCLGEPLGWRRREGEEGNALALSCMHHSHPHLLK